MDQRTGFAGPFRQAGAHASASPLRPKRSGRFTVLAAITLSLLLLIPAYALGRFAVTLNSRLIAALPVALSLVAFLAYRADKRRAEAGAWRIPESTLHLYELIGGWPGAFLAQRIFRHKISKVSYQVQFWIIVLLHQAIAFDSLRGWPITKQLWQLIKQRAG